MQESMLMPMLNQMNEPKHLALMQCSLIYILINTTLCTQLEQDKTIIPKPPS